MHCAQSGIFGESCERNEQDCADDADGDEAAEADDAMTRACGEDHPRLCADARGSVPAGGAEALRDGLRVCRRSALR